MKESYRGHYLLTSLAVVKGTCLTMTDMCVQVPVLQSSRGKLSRSIPLQEMWTCIATQNLIGRNEKKRNPNVNNQCHFYATTVISKVGISGSSANL